MKITRLVLLFNYTKILLGLGVSILLYLVSFIIEMPLLSHALLIVSILIIINILLALIASYFTYDRSDIYKLNQLPKYLDLNKFTKGVFIHASFDPISKDLERKYPNLDLSVCDIFKNRHLQESMRKKSKNAFPPYTTELKIDPTNLPFENNSQEVILAITSLHEILEHKKRVAFFKEASRVLTPNGFLVISEQIRNPINFLFFNIGAFHFLSRKHWETSIKEAGLTIFEQKKINLFSEMMIIKT